MRILFFAHLKDVTGCAAIDLPVATLDADGLWQRLVTLYPGLAPLRPTVRLARNWEYAGKDDLFTDHDEVALIPPVSGG
jgi:molybdopterin converting factor small subunit